MRKWWWPPLNGHSYRTNGRFPKWRYTVPHLLSILDWDFPWNNHLFMGYPHFRKPLSQWNDFPWNNLSQLLGYPHDYGNPLHLISKRHPAIWWLWGNIGPPWCDYLTMAMGQESPSPYEPWRIHVVILHIYIYTYIYILPVYIYIYIYCMCIYIYYIYMYVKQHSTFPKWPKGSSTNHDWMRYG